jgi:hypothetical protein
MRGKRFNGTWVVWVHPRGKSSLIENGKLVPAAQLILQAGAGIVAPDVLLTGEYPEGKRLEVNQGYAGFTFGYNRSLLAERVHDILTTVAFAKSLKDTRSLHLLGIEKAGPWVILARALCGDSVARTAADFDQFRFDKIGSSNDEMMLPGALKYGGLPAFAALCAPHGLFLHNHSGTGIGEWVPVAYQAAGQPVNLERSRQKVPTEKVVSWLLR